MKRITIYRTDFIYRWYDKDIERYYRVMFTEGGDIAGGYSYTKDEDDPGVFQEACAKAGWEDGVLMLEKFLKEDEEKNSIEKIALPEDSF